MIFKFRVAEVAQTQDLSMTRLARKADVNYKTVQAIFADPYRDIAYSTLYKLSLVLKTDVSALVEVVEDAA